MTCRCTVNSLNLFVRNVAHVDLPSASRSSHFPLRTASTRKLVPGLCNGRTPASSRANSSEAAPNIKLDADAKATRPNPSNAIAELSLDALDAILAETKLGHNENLERPATAEAKTGARGTHEYESPLKELLGDVPRNVAWKKDAIGLPGQRSEPAGKPARWASGRNGSQVKVRRNKSDSTGFTLHYSAPPSESVTAPIESHGVADKKPIFEDRRERWMIEKEAAKRKYPDGYKPMKRLSPDAIVGIRALHAQQPDYYTVPMLSKEFEVTPEAIIRILRSKWRPSPEEETDRQRRWHRRGQAVWQRWADMGTKPPKQWRELGIGNGKPEWLLRKQGKYVPPPLPALITTSRRGEQPQQESLDVDEEELESNLDDRIL